MREIVWDTETTGFEPDQGDRIVEIGAVELMSHVPTGRTFHAYINPQRSMPPGAFEVHGLGDEFLADKPLFAEVGPKFLDFVGDAMMIAHNAEFDFKFINAELGWADLPLVPHERLIDSLAIARRKFPGARNSLDALCLRFNVDNSGREKHGALLDSELLAEVYLELVGGRQPGLDLMAGAATTTDVRIERVGARPRPLAPRLSDAEAAAHAAFVTTLEGGGLWGDA